MIKQKPQLLDKVKTAMGRWSKQQMSEFSKIRAHKMETRSLETNTAAVTVECVVFRYSESQTEPVQTILSLASRAGRLPVTKVQGGLQWNWALSWSCADGRIEQLGIASGHTDGAELWQEISSHGLLVSEFMDAGAGETTLADLVPVGHWILDRHGSRDWFCEPKKPNEFKNIHFN